MGKKSKKNNFNKIGTGTIVVIAIALGVIIYGLKIATTGLLSDSKLFRNLVASITGKSSYTLDEKREAVLATADAYKDRGTNIQYDTFKKSYLSDPEDANDGDIKYTDGGAFVYSVYKKSLGIDVAPTSESLMNYADRNNESDYVVAKYNNSKETSEGYIVDSEGDYQEKATLLNDIKSKVQKGDIIVFRRLNSDTSIINHAMIVYNVESNDVKVIHARGYSYDTGIPETLYEEEGSLIEKEEDNYNHYNSYIEGVNSATSNAAIGYDNLSALLDVFTNSNTLDVGIIRPLGSDGTEFLKPDGTTKEIDLTNEAKARLEYKNIKITKTNNKFDGTTISAGDEITYTIKINNQGSSAYSNITVTENISDAGTVTNAGGGNLTTEDGVSTITWNNIDIAASGEHTITYKVKAKGSSEYVNKKITSSGNVDGISTGTIENVILYTLTNTQKNTLNDASPTGIGVEYINNWYNSLGINLDLPSTITADDVYNSDNLRTMIPNDMYISSMENIESKEINYDDVNEYGLSLFDVNYLPYNSLNKNLITGDIILTKEYINNTLTNKIYYVKNSNIYDADTQQSIYPNNSEFIESLYGKNTFAVIRPSILMPTILDISSKTLNVGVGKSLTTTAKLYKTDSKYLNTVTWSSSDTSKITVDSTGKLTGVAAGTATITATAANGITDSKTFTCKASVDSDATLSSLNLSTSNYISGEMKEIDIPLNTAFDASTTNYTATVPLENDSTYINVNAVATKSSSSIEITAPATDYYNSDTLIMLNPGNNTINIKVIAEDETEKTYTVVVNKEFTDSNLLSTLRVAGGDLDKKFSPDITEYSTTIFMDLTTSNEVYIEALPKLWAGATVTIEKPSTLVYGNNVFYIKCSGVSLPEKTYTLNVTIETPDYTDNYLSSLKVKINDKENQIAGFDKEINDYVVEVDGDVTSVNLSYTKNSSRSTIGTVTSEPAEPTTADRYIIYSIPVTAADGSVRIYTVTIVRKGNSESRLNSLVIKNENDEPLSLIPEFDKDTYDYTLDVDYDVSDLKFTAEPINPHANVQIQAPDDLVVGENIIKIAVYGEDASATCDDDDPTCKDEGISVYTITINRGSSSYNKLTDLYIQDYEISPNFNPDITGYTATVDNTVDNIYIVAEDESDYYVKIEGDGPKDLEVGSNVFEIVVTAENGDTRTYTINVTRQSEISYDNIDIQGNKAILSDEITAANLKSLVGTDDVSVLNKDKTTKSDSSQVATGDYLRIGSFDYNVVIIGDFNEDGYVDDGDVYDIFIYTFNDIFGNPNIDASESQLIAGDFNRDNTFDDGDVYDLFIYTFNKIFGGE